MFRLDDHQVETSELAVLMDLCTVGPDGCIYSDADHDRRQARRERHNCCDLYLLWHITEHLHGVSRIMFADPIGRPLAFWRERCLVGYTHHLEQRKQDIRDAFPDDVVAFTVWGWHPYHRKLKKDMGRTQILCPTKPRLHNGKTNTRTVVAEKTYD